MTADAARESPAISIIVPVYNVADFVGECLDSIRSQNFSEGYETLLIDDCSSDDSAQICDDYCAQHADFKLFRHEQNLGVSAARNLGLESARGRYFMFVDPDDLLPRDALVQLYETAEKTGSSIVKGNNTIFDSRHEKPARYNVRQAETLTGERVLVTLFEHRKLRGHPWGKLFRRDRLGSYRFPLGVRMAQDLYYCSEVFSHADSLTLLNAEVYRYRNRDTGSTGRKFKSGSYLDWLNSVETTAQFASTKAHSRAHKALMLRTMTQLAREGRKLEPPEAEAVLETLMQRCRQWRINFNIILLEDRLDLRSLSRYLKLRLAIRELRARLAQSGAVGGDSR